MLIKFLYKTKSHFLKAKESHKLRKMLFVIIPCAILIFVISYWLYSNRYLNTDDAYVNAHTVQIAARVSAPILHLDVANNQFVKAGQTLFELDPAQFKIAVDKAEAQLAIAEAESHNAELKTNRTLALVKLKYVANQVGDSAITDLKTAIGGVQLSKAGLVQAQLNLSYTKVVAPTDGWITNLSLREGDIVDADQPLFALVDNHQYWVDANFKETELQKIHSGQKAKIALDMYPDHIFHGVVESLSDGSGTAFSLMPPQNAIGNWVKVTQRVPVKILITDPDPNYPLRIGTTATVTIDTHS
jgi:membrane fusion protein (multidrug efflux system)